MAVYWLSYEIDSASKGNAANRIQGFRKIMKKFDEKWECGSVFIFESELNLNEVANIVSPVVSNLDAAIISNTNGREAYVIGKIKNGEKLKKLVPYVFKTSLGP